MGRPLAAASTSSIPPSSSPVTTIHERAVEEITERLSSFSDLNLPSALSRRGDSLTQADKKAHLLDLLRRDAAIFLERHGSRLSTSELKEFDVLSEDYEVNWHLTHLRSSLIPITEKEQKAHASLVKNRRLAYMDKLIQAGDFFSEDAMRMRAPLLFHEYLGKFEDPSERAFARQGERWSEMLIRQGEEAEYQARLKIEREMAGIPTEDRAQEDEVEEEEEEEEEEDDAEEEPLDQNLGKNVEKETSVSDDTGTSESRVSKLEKFSQYMYDKFMAESSSKPSISIEELQYKRHDFMRIMQEKFLSGEDSEHFDYVQIDSDAALDDYWFEEISQDAEDKYFEDV